MSNPELYEKALDRELELRSANRALIAENKVLRKTLSQVPKMLRDCAAELEDALKKGTK